MNIRFYLDPETNTPHVHEHGVEEHKVEEMLEDPGEVRKGRNGSLVALGQTAAGRYLKTVYIIDEDDGGLFVVTSYDLKGKPLDAYRRRKKKSNK